MENGFAQVLDSRTGEALWSMAVGGFTHWQSPIVVDGAIYVTDSDGFLMRFVPRSHIVTPAAIDPRRGSIDPSDPQTVADGGQVKFVVTALAPYVIDYVFGCYGTEDGGYYLTGQIFEDCTVTAAFTIDPAELIFRDGFDQGAR
jgi:outer membrane protein assembly factor BamB